MGVHGSPLDTGWWRGVPHRQRTCEMWDTGAAGKETSLCSSARACGGWTHYADLFPLSPSSVYAYVWQPSLLIVVLYVWTVSRFGLGFCIHMMVSPRITLIWLDRCSFHLAPTPDVLSFCGFVCP
jgi:hypothetical protein